MIATSVCCAKQHKRRGDLVADVADANISLAEHDEKGKGSGLAGNYDLIAMATYGRSGLEH